MNTWWSYFVLGRRYRTLDDRLCVRRYWWSRWQPLRLRKVAGAVHITDEAFARFTRGEL